jgi:hypothetical protein
VETTRALTFRPPRQLVTIFISRETFLIRPTIYATGAVGLLKSYFISKLNFTYGISCVCVYARVRACVAGVCVRAGGCVMCVCACGRVCYVCARVRVAAGVCVITFKHTEAGMVTLLDVNPLRPVPTF